jgi:multiple sugar transport system permease protein
MGVNKKKKVKGVFIHIILLIGVVISLLPFVWMVLTSFKTMAESINVPMIIFPKKFSFDNYKDAMSILPFKSFYFNTAISTLFRVLGQVFFCSLAGFAFARMDFPFKNVLFSLMLSILMIPSQLYLLPHFMIMQKMGLLNTVAALMLPGLFGAFGTFLMRQFFLNIPKEVEEAALLDGCNYLQVYFHIFLPMSKPALLSLAVLVGLRSWNDLMWPLIVNNSMDKMTLSAGIASLQGQYFTNYPVLMAGAVLSSLPVIILFFILQNKVLEGISFTKKI